MGQGLLGLAVPEVRPVTVYARYQEENMDRKAMARETLRVRSGWDRGRWTPPVVFFRDESFRLTETPVKASVLTLPAVNMGQVLLKGENVQEAKKAMRRRMRLALGIFAEQKAKHLVLGAYGCGVFRNDPGEVAVWWRELLEEGIGRYFDSVFHAVLDHSKEKNCIKAFQELSAHSIAGAQGIMRSVQG